MGQARGDLIGGTLSKPVLCAARGHL